MALTELHHFSDTLVLPREKQARRVLEACKSGLLHSCLLPVTWSQASRKDWTLSGSVDLTLLSSICWSLCLGAFGAIFLRHFCSLLKGLASFSFDSGGLSLRPTLCPVASAFRVGEGLVFRY